MSANRAFPLVKLAQRMVFGRRSLDIRCTCPSHRSRLGEQQNIVINKLAGVGLSIDPSSKSANKSVSRSLIGPSSKLFRVLTK